MNVFNVLSCVCCLCIVTAKSLPSRTSGVIMEQERENHDARYLLKQLFNEMSSAMNGILVAKRTASEKGNRKDQMEDKFVNFKDLASKMKVIVVTNETVLDENNKGNSSLSETVGVFKNIFSKMINAINNLYTPTNTSKARNDKENETISNEIYNTRSNETNRVENNTRSNITKRVKNNTRNNGTTRANNNTINNETIRIQNNTTSNETNRLKNNTTSNETNRVKNDTKKNGTGLKKAITRKEKKKNSLKPILIRLKESDKDTSRSVIYYEEGSGNEIENETTKTIQIVQQKISNRVESSKQNRGYQKKRTNVIPLVSDKEVRIIYDDTEGSAEIDDTEAESSGSGSGKIDEGVTNDVLISVKKTTPVPSNVYQEIINYVEKNENMKI